MNVVLVGEPHFSVVAATCLIIIRPNLVEKWTVVATETINNTKPIIIGKKSAPLPAFVSPPVVVPRIADDDDSNDDVAVEEDDDDRGNTISMLLFVPEFQNENNDESSWPLSSKSPLLHGSY